MDPKYSFICSSFKHIFSSNFMFFLSLSFDAIYLIINAELFAALFFFKYQS